MLSLFPFVSGISSHPARRLPGPGRMSPAGTVAGDRLSLRFSGQDADRRLEGLLDNYLRQGERLGHARGDLEHLSQALATLAPDQLSDPLHRGLRQLMQLEVGYMLSRHQPRPAPPENGGIGTVAYEALLRKQGVDVDTNTLIERISRDADAIERRMDELARKIEPGKSWQQVYDRLRRDHPSEDAVVETYRQRVQSLAGFLKEKDLLGLPEEPLRVEQTPPNEASTHSVAFYNPPSRTVRITPAVSPEPGKRALELREHNRHAMDAILAHEGIPGHHLHEVRSGEAWRKASPGLRRFYSESKLYNTFFVEGWALYCEKLLLDQGFYDKPEQELVALRALLWRAMRAKLNAEFHSGRITALDVAAEMRARLGMDDSLALSEAAKHVVISGNRYPTQPASYYLGLMQIEQLRDRVKQADLQFTLKRFHDRLLDNLKLPVPVVARMAFDLDLGPVFSDETRLIRFGAVAASPFRLKRSA